MKTQALLLVLIFTTLPALLSAQADSFKVDSLFELVFDLREQGNYTEALKEARFALDMAQQIKYKEREGDLYVQMGRCHKELNYLREAITDYENALVIRKSINDVSGVASVYNNMSSVYDLLENYPRGYECSLAAIKIWSGLGGQEKNLAKAYNNLANIFEGRWQIDSATLYNQKSIDLFPIAQDNSTLATAEYGMGKRLLNKQDYDKARYYLNRAFESYRLLNDSVGQAMALEGLGAVAIKTGQIKEAERYYNQADSLYQALGDSVSLCDVYQNLGLLFEAQERYGKARLYYDKAAHYMLASEGAVREDQERKRFGGIKRLEFIQTISDLVTIKEKSDRLNLWIFILLFACAFLAIFSAIQSKHAAIQSNLARKEAVRVWEIERDMASLKHSVVKSSLHTINNELFGKLENFEKDSLGYKLIYSTRNMIDRLLTRIGYPPKGTYKIATIKPFAKEMHRLAEETSFMLVENHSYGLDETDDYPVSDAIQKYIEAIVLEAFHNIHKYAKCTHSHIGFSVDEAGLTVEISDDGVGFNPDDIRKGAEGLQSIRDGAKLVNARCSIVSAPGQGTTIKINIPYFPE